MIYLEAAIAIFITSTLYLLLYLFLLRYCLKVVCMESRIFYLECVFFGGGVAGMVTIHLNHLLCLSPSTTSFKRQYNS